MQTLRIFGDEVNTGVPLKLPKNLKHLTLEGIHFTGPLFSSEMILLEKLEFGPCFYISNAILAYVAINCLELQSLKIESK